MKRFFGYIGAILLYLTGCSATLVDYSNNAFIAAVTKGDFEDKVVVTWIPNSFFSKYQVLRSEREFGEYISIAEDLTVGTYEDTAIQAGKEFYYKIQAFNNVGHPFYITEPVVGYAGAEGGFFPPNMVDVESGVFTDKIKISWSRVPEATDYDVWKSENGILFTLVDTVSHLHYIDTSVSADKEYFYQISSVKNGIPSSGRSIIKQGKVFSGGIDLEASAGVSPTQINITWVKHPFAKEYDVYRSTVNTDKGTKIATIAQSADSKYEDKNLNKGDVFYYTIIYKNDTAQLQSPTVRGYTADQNAPAQPQNFTVGQGVDKVEIDIAWDAVATATSYELERSTSAQGPWTTIYSGANTTYTDTPGATDYDFYYRVTAKNSSLGRPSVVKQGWALKAPIDITASKNLAQAVIIKWRAVPQASKIELYASETLSGTYTKVRDLNGDTTEVTYDIVMAYVGSKKFYFKLAAISKSGLKSDLSAAVEGEVKKVLAPASVAIMGNKTATKSMTLAWKPVTGAAGYRIYKATLAHKGADPAKIVDGDYKLLATTQNPSYAISFNTYPIRREMYLVKSIDSNGDESEGSAKLADVVWRLPVDVIDFLKDVDVTILQAQMQVPSFGALGSAAVINARFSGNYDYSAKIGSIKNTWNDYISFEIQLTGNPKMSISLSPMGSFMDGDVFVSGIYNGKVRYNKLLGEIGGYSTKGSISAEYTHPTLGTLSTNLNLNEAGITLNSVVLKSEAKPTMPVFEEGAGL